jgi:exonuclease VII large subunit
MYEQDLAPLFRELADALRSEFKAEKETAKKWLLKRAQASIQETSTKLGELSLKHEQDLKLALQKQAEEHQQTLKQTLEKQAEEHKQNLNFYMAVLMGVFIATFLAVFATFMLWGLNFAIKNEVTEQLTHQQVTPKPSEVSTQPAPVALLPTPVKVLHQAKP